VLLALIGPPKGPQVYILNGKTLERLNTIFLPNIHRDNFQFFVKSPCELNFVRVDSSDYSLCLLDRPTTRKMGLRGRWYKLDWATELQPGSKTHAITFTARSGLVFKFNFIVNVEGTAKSKRPRGEY
jgi:hypothetical protein